MNQALIYPEVTLEHADEILKLDLGVCQPGNERLFELLGKLIPLKIHRYPSRREHNGWEVAQRWCVNRATIDLDGQRLFDGMVHPLAVAGYSCSFQGTLSRQELSQHVFYRENVPDGYTYHCNNYYRPWMRDWGFCVPYNLWRTWPEGSYQIDLQTEYSDSEMLVAECHLQGESDETIVFNAHSCHPAQFNDGLAGIYTIVALFRWLSTQKRHYSYRAVFAPEHIGTVFYCAGLKPRELKRLKLGVFTEMTGLEQPLVLQQSFHGDSLVDRIATHVLRQHNPQVEIGKFRTILGNDETVWEAPGIEVPFISISRANKNFAFRDYHTNFDNLELNKVAKLNEALRLFVDMISILEQDRVMARTFNGLIALSNPRFNLYVERLDPSVIRDISPTKVRLGALQDLVPRYFDGNHSIFEIAEHHNLAFPEILDYISRFAAKGLVKFRHRKSIAAYDKRPFR